MPLETGTYISDLVVTNPVSADNMVDGDDHLRLIKSTIKTTFPNVTGVVTPSHTELGFVAGVTSGIQAQINTGSSNTSTALAAANAALPKAGGTMSGPIAMGNSKITGVANGSAATDVAAFGQLGTKADVGVANTFTGNNINSGTETFNNATSFNNAMNFNEAGLTVTAGVTAWDMTTQGPDVNIPWSSANNLTITNPTATPSGPARGTIRIVNSTGATRTISWGANFNTLSAALPTQILFGQQMVLRYWTQGSTVYIVGIDTLAPYPARFTSAQQTITAASVLNIAHGLVSIPTKVTGYIQNITTEGNYAVGDRVWTPCYGGANGIMLAADATNVVALFGSPVTINNKTTDAAFNITTANWKLVVVAEL